MGALSWLYGPGRREWSDGDYPKLYKAYPSPYSAVQANLLLCKHVPKSANVQDDLLTSDQVVECLLAEPTLRRKASTCVLRAVRVGAEWRFRRSDLDAWIAQQLRLNEDLPQTHES
jgi:excisionase family DNA binding protein